MKRFLPVLFCTLLFNAGTASGAQPDKHGAEAVSRGSQSGKRDCDTGPAWCKSEEGACSPEKRGRCGKRRGDWYGARQPVTTAAEARRLLLNYFTGHEYTVSEVVEKKWGFKADVFDRDGKVIDRVMIDKRSGRIRSLD